MTGDGRWAGASGGELAFGPGQPADAGALLTLWDEAIAWLVARGQTGQWGSQPASARPRARDMLSTWLSGPGSTIAWRSGTPVGISVVSSTPPAHVTRVSVPERYIHFLLTSRAHAGQRLGSELVRRAAVAARADGAGLLRVDCWAGAPSLVAWYERQGFVRSDTFLVGDWRGQVFEMEL